MGDQKPIPFGNQQMSGHERLAGASPIAINVVMDAAGAVRRRPVIQDYAEGSTATIDALGIDGVWASVPGQLFAVASNDPAVTTGTRTIYQVTSSGGQDLSALATSGEGTLAGSGRPVFAETEMLLVMAGGGAMQRIETLTAGTPTGRLGGSPPEATHVSANRSRLLANASLQAETAIQYSEVFGGTSTYAGAEVWTLGGVGTSGFFKAEARADTVLAQYETMNEVFVWGESSLQVFAPDAQLVYASVSAREFGISARYSPIRMDSQFAFLDHKRHFIMSDGRTFNDISAPIQQDLDDMAVVSDCWGFRTTSGPIDCLVWTFPTEGRTFAYQQGIGWGQWQGESNGQVSPWIGNCHHARRDTGVEVVGTTTGRVGKLVMDASDDLGTTVTAKVTTGFLNRGTLNLKSCDAVYIALERGTTTSTVEPLAFLQFADAPDQWSEPIPIGLGLSGDRFPVIPLRSLGVYRERAWRFTFSATENFSLARVVEEFTVLGN